jgi:DNA-binding CsgD family transcriptional regulator
VAVFHPADRANADELQEYPEAGPSHPLRRPLGLAHPSRPPARAGRRPPPALRISDVLAPRAWASHPLRSHSHRTVSDQLAMVVSASARTAQVVTLSRSRGTFDDDQRDVLTQAGPHLRHALARCTPDGLVAWQLSPAPGLVPLHSAPGLLQLTAAVPALTTREREVLTLVANGLSDAQIGRRLGITSATVSKHLQRIYRRHGLANRAAAAALVSSSSVPR